jgi:hypothetical protein
MSISACPARFAPWVLHLHLVSFVECLEKVGGGVLLEAPGARTTVQLAPGEGKNKNY